MKRLNLLTDPFIPALTTTGRAMVSLPDMLDPCVIEPDFPTPVMNSSIKRLVISTVNAFSPLDEDEEEDWRDRLSPGPKNITEHRAPYMDAFCFGAGRPSFLTEFADIRDAAKGMKKPVERLIFDAPKENTLLQNKNIFYDEGRYPSMTASFFIPVLFDSQSQAFGIGPGFRTAMAGQGVPNVTVDPEEGLAAYILANVMPGIPVDPKSFPWLRPTDRSGNPVIPPKDGKPTGELWFPQPKCIQPDFDEEGNVDGYYEIKNGNNYEGWITRFAPRKYVKEMWRGATLKPGPRSYRDWLGVTLSTSGGDNFRIPEVVRSFRERDRYTRVSLVVEGWALDSSKMKEYISSRQRVLRLGEEENDLLVGMILAADIWQRDLRMAFRNTCYYRYSKKPKTSRVRFEQLENDFYTRTDRHFQAAVDLIQNGKDLTEAAKLFRDGVRKVAVALFEEEFLSEMSRQDMAFNQEALKQRNVMLASLNGSNKSGKIAYERLGLEPMKKGVAA